MPQEPDSRTRVVGILTKPAHVGWGLDQVHDLERCVRLEDTYHEFLLKRPAGLEPSVYSRDSGAKRLA